MPRYAVVHANSRLFPMLSVSCFVSLRQQVGQTTGDPPHALLPAIWRGPPLSTTSFLFLAMVRQHARRMECRAPGGRKNRQTNTTLDSGGLVVEKYSLALNFVSKNFEKICHKCSAKFRRPVSNTTFFNLALNQRKSEPRKSERQRRDEFPFTFCSDYSRSIPKYRHGGREPKCLQRLLPRGLVHCGMSFSQKILQLLLIINCFSH